MLALPETVTVTAAAAAAAAVVHMAPCSAHQRLTRLLRHSRPWQESGLLGSGPTRGQKWPRGVLSACPGRSCRPCFSMEAMDTRIPAIEAVSTATPLSTGTRWLFSTSPAALSAWLLALLCGQRVVSWSTTQGRRRRLSRAKYRRRSTHRHSRETRRFPRPMTLAGLSQPRTSPAMVRPPEHRGDRPGSPSNSPDGGVIIQPAALCHSSFVLHNVHPLGYRMPELCMTYHIPTILLMF